MRPARHGTAEDTGDVRPRVALPRPSTPPWLLGGGAVLGAVVLFLILDGQRRARTRPAEPTQATSASLMIAPLPPLALPPEPVPPPPRPLLIPSHPRGAAAAPTAVPAQPPVYTPLPPPVFSPPPVYTPPGNVPAPAYVPPQPAAERTGRGATNEGSVLVIDTARDRRANTGAAERSENPAGAPEPSEGGPVTSTSIRRPGSTVAQGKLIPAVLETAIDSTRPGLVRAVVSRDIASLDGRRILIPRGSRLTGDYDADLTTGQTRAMIRWTRLVRPDGDVIALDSPAADLGGRAGVTGRVDNRFLQRFSRALLRTILNVGGSLATREIGGDTGGVIIALPGSTQNAGAAGAADPLPPIVRVDAGARIAVLVARDLEFASGTARR